MQERARSRLKYAYYAMRDRHRWKRRDLSRLDYRNYLDATTINRGDQAIVDAIVRKLQSRRVDLRFRRVNWQGLTQIPDTTDLVAICGGGYLFLDQNAQLAPRVTADLAMFRESAVPIVMFGVGINQLLGTDAMAAPQLAPSQAATIRALLQRVNLISVRDWATQRALQPYTDKPVHMVADPALFLAPPRPAERQPGSPLKVGINLPFHGPTSMGHIRRNLPKYVELLRRIQREHACSFVYVVHYATERVIAQLLRESGLPMSIVSGSPDALVAAYADLDIHLGGMLHSCILSTSAGTPCIGLAYDVKHSGFFEVMGLSAHCVSAVQFDIAEVQDICNRMLAALKPLRETILQRRLVLEAEFDRFLNQAEGLVDIRHTANP